MKTLRERWDAAKLKFTIGRRPTHPLMYEIYDRGFQDGVRSTVAYLHDVGAISEQKVNIEIQLDEKDSYSH